ncbi:MAG: prolipoprotein diacylglyceryl transferase [Chloroflexi bacterium SZAS-1]|nr:prolipoprotein diacylglyceryl transferase [Chloroflexi bacterium SZAS-1]
MFPVLQIGSIALPAAPLALLLGVWTGVWLAEREAVQLGLNGDAVASLVLIGLVAGLIGARVGYVAQHLGSYLTDPLGVLSLNPATLALLPGLLLGGSAMQIAGQRKLLPLWRTLDALAPGLAMLGVAVGVAHLASGDAFGAPAQLPWSIMLWEEACHPSQIYEIVGALLVLMIWRWSPSRQQLDGVSFLLVVALSAAARVFLEAFRGDSWIIAGGLRGAQLVGLAVLALCLAALPRLTQRTLPPPSVAGAAEPTCVARQETAP